ncbi:protein TMED8 isoform X2 [Salmo trutta]|uniref:Transmembrane p24 trafficking protein 8 n=1 Tax=Salmo trutta TaxID=8032 RepID=A0A673XDZ3_SALTR|nr:protein TMED8-like isoform X2 [Salmo trutta]
MYALHSTIVLYAELCLEVRMVMLSVYRLQSRGLSNSNHPISHPDMDGTNGTEGSNQPAEVNQQSPAGQQATGGDVEESNSSGNSQNPGERKAQMPPLKPPSTWTSMAIKELKAKLRLEKDSVVTVKRGNIMTVHVPTIPEGKQVCWEFATDSYDIAFGIYFDWNPVTSQAITVHISESSDDEEEENQLEGLINTGDVEKASKSLAKSNIGEILPVYRLDSHMAVQGGSHEYPGKGTYLLKFNNSYSLWRNKTLYYRVYYSA